MPLITSQEAEESGLLRAAELMLISARTAPKAKGEDDILTAMIFGEDKEKLASEMERMADERRDPGFRRDARSVRDSSIVIIIGVRGTKTLGLNCGGCGFPNCDAMEKAAKVQGNDFTGPNCIFKILDLGIALGSAAKTADILNVDNRIMYRVGAAAKRLNLLPEASVIMGIPLSAKGKNIFFDRQ